MLDQETCEEKILSKTVSFHIHHDGGGYYWSLHDDRNRKLSESGYSTLDPEGVVRQIRPLIETFKGTHNIQFQYQSLIAAKKVGMALGGEEEAQRAISQAKELINRRKQQQKLECSEMLAKKGNAAIWIIIILGVIAIVGRYL